MSNKATEVLEKQINQVQEDIIQNKVDIADLFVKVHSLKPILKSDFEDLMERVTEMDKMEPLVEKLEKNQAKLETLLKSKSEIEQAYLV